MRRPVTVMALAAAVLAAAGCRPGSVGQKWPDPNRPLVFSARASADVGLARHLEDSNLQPLSSDWQAVVYRPRALFDLRTRAGLEFSAEASAFFTDWDQEQWEYAGLDVADNDLRIGGWEFRALAGWGADVERFGRISLLGGVTGRFTDLDRKFGDGSTEKLEVDMLLWEVEGRLALPLGPDTLELPPVTFEASTSYGRLFKPEVDVDGVGTIEGDYGWLFRARAGLDFRFTERTSAYLGGFYEILKIQGGTKGLYDWADSESTAAGGEVGLRVRF